MKRPDLTLDERDTLNTNMNKVSQYRKSVKDLHHVCVRLYAPAPARGQDLFCNQQSMLSRRAFPIGFGFVVRLHAHFTP
jgi:hypothetical protein